MKKGSRLEWERHLLSIQRDLAISLNETSSIEEGLRLCLEATLEAAMMDSGAMYLFDEKKRIFRLAVQKNIGEECIKVLSVINEGAPIWELIMGGKSIVGGFKELRMNINDADLKERIKVIALLPIAYKNKMVGCLIAASCLRKRLPKYVLNALEVMANQLGICITAIRTHDALQRSEAKYREFIDLLPDIVFELDLEGKFTYASRLGFEKTGYTEDDIEKGLDAVELVVPEHRERIRNNMLRVLKGERVGYNEYIALRKDGRRFPVEIRSSPIFKDGKVSGIRGIVVDITDRKRVEEELVKGEKFEALSILAGGIAHDFNNLIAIILGNIEIIETEPVNDNIREALISMEKAIMRAKSLTEQLMTFTKEGIPMKRVASIADLIKETSVFSLRGTKASCIFNIEEDLWYVEMDEAKISQVIGNILLNSVQAMPEGGLIEIFASNEIVSEDNDFKIQPGKYIKVSIKDHGIGIPKDKLPYIFDPYFTTKEKGHGLGLASSYIIIKKHSGYIYAESEYGGGTTITFYLPAVEKMPISREDTEREILKRGKGRILLMDDEEEIRKTIGGMLNKLGYEVEEASDGKEMLEKYKHSLLKKPFDLVMMDLTVSGVIGAIETIKELLKIDSSTKAILMTGYTTDDVLIKYREYGFKDVIVKPFKIAALNRVISKIICAE